jgi:drug/metabolite transporter (DMT)-like permease
MQSDTRKLLTTGTAILLVGAIAALLMLTVFGGVSREGPHTNSGWLALVIALGCVPTAAFTLFLGLAKLIGDSRHDS